MATYRDLHRYWWAPLQRVLERAKARGELDQGADTGALIDVMLGTAWYRMLLEHAPPDDTLAYTVIALVTADVRADGTAPKTR